MKRLIAGGLAATLLFATLAEPVQAAVNVSRSGDENPMKELGTSVIYGAATGALVGGAIALADDGGNDWDKVRVGIVVGTFVGLGVGFYFLARRPSATGALELRDGGMHWNPPLPEVASDGELRVNLLGARF